MSRSYEYWIEKQLEPDDDPTRCGITPPRGKMWYEEWPLEDKKELTEAERIALDEKHLKRYGIE